MSEILALHLIIALLVILSVIKMAIFKYYRKITFDINKYVNKKSKKAKEYIHIIESRGLNLTETQKMIYIMYREEKGEIKEAEVIQRIKEI